MDLRKWMISNRESARRSRLQKHKHMEELMAQVANRGHMIGLSRCALFSGRLSNFNSSGAPDATLDNSLIPELRSVCPVNGDGNNMVALENRSRDPFDNSYFRNLVNGRGIL
ncbi:peroxidase N-like [Salvia miltiorrhiza]|uniref:peroxidase N-like n=1 Tax=Salvia miltiorrhiza TaxID=226208 RepID=UPI0025AC5359|nr:peroxidase N-like [Salvia miltiorrhiza]